MDTLVGLEKQRQMAGCSDNVSCIAELAGALGVETVAVADVGRLGSQTIVSVKVIDARRATVRLRAKRVARSDEQLVRVSEELAGEVVATMTGAPVVLPPRAVAPAPGPTSAPVDSPRGGAWRVAGYVAGGLGLAALGVGAFAGLRANEAGSTLLSKPASSRTEVQRTWDSEKSNASLASGLFVAGGLLLGFPRADRFAPLRLFFVPMLSSVAESARKKSRTPGNRRANDAKRQPCRRSGTGAP